MDHLAELEHKSVHIFREAYANFKSLCMLWSIGKDSTVLLWLARKAFYGVAPLKKVPFACQTPHGSGVAPPRWRRKGGQEANQ